MSPHRLLAVAALALGGCAETCPLPQDALNQKIWDLFGRVTVLEQEQDPAWPAESLPFNGPHLWTIDWASNDFDGARVIVTIDEQVFEGTGSFDDVECGNFVVTFGGTYAAEDGAEHEFNASARLATLPEGLDGFVEFKSTWRTPADAIGSAAGIAQLTTAASPGAATP
jgi:hypothetical protein